MSADSLNIKAGMARKAIIGGVVALLGSFATALADGDLTLPEIGAALLTAGVAVLSVYQIPNDAPVGE